MNEVDCPVCLSKSPTLFIETKSRPYYECNVCQLVFVTKEFHLDIKGEKKIYDLHENNPDDQRYRAHLERITKPLCDRIESHSKGIDFGCGPGPTISVMMNELAHHCYNYDPFYFPNEELLKDQYDFITLTEVAEHLVKPREVFLRLKGLLRKGGILAIMTQPAPVQEKFANWYYKNDPTHITFFRSETFEYLAKMLELECEFISQDVTFFKMP